MATRVGRYEVGLVALAIVVMGGLVLTGRGVLAANGGGETQLPAWIIEWKHFAEQSGRPDDRKWVELISAPVAVKLDQDWAKWRGYTAPELVEKGRAAGEIPPELKPGLVITKDNYKNFPWLSKFTTQAVIDRVADPTWYSFKSIRVVPTNSYHYSRERLEAQYAEKGQFELDYTTGALKIKDCTTCEAGKVIPETWGQKSCKFPFAPHPKDGLELVWMYILHNVQSDNLFFKPIDFILTGSDNKIERTYTADLWWKNFWGRVQYPPMPMIPGTPQDNYQGGAIFFLHPLDVKGLCGVRIRHFDPTQDDTFQIFIPALKRTRVMAGSDTQDPLCAGCDLAWDDWRAFWVKMDARQFDYKLEGEGYHLRIPDRGLVGDQYIVDPDNNFREVDMELVPVWKVVITDKTGKYLYSKRVIWLEKDKWWHAEEQMYDKEGRVWRDWFEIQSWNPSTGESMARGVIVWDVVNHHASTLRMNTNFEQARYGTKQEYFDIDTLRTYR